MGKLTYLHAIRKHCVECMGGSPQLVDNCPSLKCKFYPYRFGKIPAIKPNYTPLKAIRLYCLECVGTSDEVKKCSMPECPVYYYRFGKNPHLKNKNPKGNPKALKIFRQNSSGQQFLASNLNDLSQIKVNIPILAKNRL